MFVKHADSRNPAEQEPQALRASIQNAQQDCGAKHPQYRLESIHGEKIVEGEINRRQQHGESGEHLREPSAAHLARHPPGEKHLGAGRQRGKEPQRKERVAEQRAGHAGDEGHQRRVVHVSPGEMLATSGVVEFVAEISVAAVAEEMNHAGRRGQRENGCA